MRVDDGHWHKIRIIRKRRFGLIQVDNTPSVKKRSPKGASVLNTDGNIWLGKLNWAKFFSKKGKKHDMNDEGLASLF